MVNKQPSMLTNQVIRDGLSYILRGGLNIKNGHLPNPGHQVPDDFFGVCIATNSDPATDSYVIKQLKELGVKNVRLDFSYDDLDKFTERFLKTLLAEDFHVTLHLLPPYEAARNMESAAEQSHWRTFLKAVLNMYGTQIKQVEIGNTINRKRWAGFTLDGFLGAWAIADTEIKSRRIKLLGPNIQDFEPLYNISILKTLQAKNQLPDVHTNNLFVERVSEPERFDHRIFKYRWASIFKYNLIKKSRLLQKIGHDYGVMLTASSTVFWAIYRIERLLEDGAKKQADYLARYFTLLAASGSLQQANWGALICHREGLIDDGLQDADYPALERVAHYKNVDGNLKNYTQQPSFYAMQTVVRYLSGAHYHAAIATGEGLEIHHFSNHHQQIHIAWVTNGRTAFLQDTYTASTLEAAKMLQLNGEPLEKNTALITETPIYLIWHEDSAIETKPRPALAKDLAIHIHIEDLQYFQFNEAGWKGLILAEDATEATLLLQSLHPVQLQNSHKTDALRLARNAIWTIEDPRDRSRQLTVKQPVKMYPHKAFLDRFKPSKAKRSWNGAMELMRRGITTAAPIAYFEKIDDKTLKQNFYICEYVKDDCSIGQLFSAFARGESSFPNLSPENVFSQLAQFCHKMHSRGIHFRDLSGGNILVNILSNNTLRFSLIDTARIHSFTHPIPLRLRIADLTRACHKLDWAGRKRFMQIYLGLTGRQFTWLHQLQFYLYDFKVGLKRTIGRKGFKRLLRRFKGSN